MDNESVDSIQSSELQKYKCMITQQIFQYPVVASDGHIYEKEAIEEWLKERDTSPITREKISKILHPVHMIRTDVQSITTKHRKARRNQYHRNFEPNVVYDIIVSGEQEDLLGFVDFRLRYEYKKKPEPGLHKVNSVLKDMKKHVIRLTGGHMEHDESFSADEMPEDMYGQLIDILLQKCTDQRILTYVIDNAADLWVQSDYDNVVESLPMHHICQTAHIDVIKYALERSKRYFFFSNKILYATDDSGYTPVRYIIERFGTDLEMVRLLLSFNMSRYKDHIGNTLFMYYCKYGNDTVCQYLLNNIQSLSGVNIRNQMPIHLLLENTDISQDFISQYLDNIVSRYDLENRMSPIYPACIRQVSTEILEKIEEIYHERDIYQQPQSELHPLYIAALNSNREIITYIIDKTSSEILTLPVDINIHIDQSKNSKKVLPIQLIYLNHHLDIEDIQHLMDKYLEKVT